MTRETSYTVIDPATEEAITTVPLASEEETDAAVARARAAFPAWRAMAPGDRARLLREVAAAIDAHAEELAALEVRNAGHPIGQARWEAANARDVFSYFAAAPERNTGRQIPVPGGWSVTFAEPLGVVGVIVPWNFPMPILAWGAAPALAAGKHRHRQAGRAHPAHRDPHRPTRRRGGPARGRASGAARSRAGRRGAAGAPPRRRQDHVHRVHRRGQAHHGRLRRRREAGDPGARREERQHRLRRRRHREGRGRRPRRVFDNAGQDCCARSRLLVQREVFDRFMELLEPAVTGIAVGDPRDAATEMGPLISAAQRDRVASYVPQDAPVAFRGTAPQGPGFWFPPTVLLPPGPDDRAFTEEIFGPVVCVLPFDDEADAVRIANTTEFGLAGSIWTRDVGRALRVSRAVTAGNLSVNSHSAVRYWTPFGGFKQSGIGRELGPDALDAFTDTKTVFVSDDT